MTRPARIKLGDPKLQQPLVTFPSPDLDVGPRRISSAASYILKDDFWVNLRRIYGLIGFDAPALAKYLRFTRREKAIA